MSKNPNKIKNGGKGTAVGNFLRSIDFKDAAAVVGNIATGQIAEAVNILTNSGDLNAQELQLALKEMEFDIMEMQEVTKRAVSDNEHTVTRLVRPITYAAMFVMFLFMVFLDGNIGEFKIQEQYIPVIQSLFSTMTIFYFGSRGAEKITKLIKKNYA